MPIRDAHPLPFRRAKRPFTEAQAGLWPTRAYRVRAVERSEMAIRDGVSDRFLIWFPNGFRVAVARYGHHEGTRAPERRELERL
jgi:hypothetical protein